MKNLLLIFAVSFMYTASARAQGAISMQSTGEGFFLGAHLGAASWTADDLEIDGESGGGAGITLGYGFSQLISAYFTADAASISPDIGGSYTLGHGDLGVMFSFGSTTSAVRPYVDAAFSVRQAKQDIQDETGTQEFTVSGAGLSVGGGVRYHLSLPFAIDAGAQLSLGEFTEVELGGVSITLPEAASATSVRINVGIVWFPGQ